MKLVTALKWSSVVTLALAAVACDKPGEDAQKKRDQAQTELNQAQLEAQKKVDQAQANADQKVQIANADFQKSVVDYRIKREKDLADIDKSIADLQNKSLTATGKTKATIDDSLPAIRAQRDAFEKQLRNLDIVSPATFDQTKVDLDKSYDDLKKAISKAD